VSRRVLAVVGGAFAMYVAAYWVPGSPLPRVLPWGVITQGVIFGSSNALLAMGLILVHRTTRVVNFAYGALGAMAGALSVGLFAGKGWNYWVALAAGLVLGTVTGAIVDILVLRRFDRSSRLVATVATLGLAQVFGAIALGMTIGLGADALIGNLETPIDASVFIRPYPVRGDHLLMLALVPLALVGIGWFLFRTDAGRAVRAAADDSDRAQLLGVPVGRLRTIVGAVAGALSTATYVTKVPFTGVIPNASVAASAILPALAIAVVARFKSLPTALAVGIGLGIAEWAIRWNTRAESAFNVVFLVVILVALLVQRPSTSRAESADASWEGADALRSLPDSIRRVPAVRTAGFGLWAAVAAVIAVIAATAAPSTLVLVAFAFVWAMVGLSLVVLTGWSGNVSLGQFAIVGVGAMTAGNLLVRWNVDAFVAIAAAGVVGALLSAVIGIPALRLPGYGLAVATMAFAVALDSYFLNPVNFRTFVPSEVVRPVLWKRFDLADQRVLMWLCLGGLLAAVAVVRAMRRARAGRVVIATRDNARFAGALSVHTTWTRLQAFMVAGALAGVAGGLHVIVLAGAGQGTFRPELSIEVFSYAAIGGLSAPAGAIFGVLSFRAVDYALAEWFSGQTAAIIRLSLSGTGLLVVLYVMPGGLWQAVQRVRDRGVTFIMGRRLEPEAVPLDAAPADEVEQISGALTGTDDGLASRR
jgi:branched-chain amino acid transport system permease protein